MLDDSPSVALLGSDRRQCTGPVLERGLTHPPVPNRGKVSLRLQLLHHLGRNSLRFLGLSRLSLRSTSLSCSRHDYLPTAIRAAKLPVRQLGGRGAFVASLEGVAEEARTRGFAAPAFAGCAF